MENKRAHLEMIQAVINRMSVNSFLLKGWSVVLISALSALAASNSRVIFVYLACFPAIMFWILDGYFLHQERLFRGLYNHVLSLPETAVDFSMDTSAVNGKKGAWPLVIFSKTLLVFHGTILVFIMTVIIVIVYTH